MLLLLSLSFAARHASSDPILVAGQQAAISAFREPSYGFGTLDVRLPSSACTLVLLVPLCCLASSRLRSMLCLQIINATTAQWQWHRNAVRFQCPYTAFCQCHGTSLKAGSAGVAIHTKAMTVCLSPVVTAAMQALTPRLL